MIATPMALEVCGATVTAGWVDWTMSSMSNSAMREAWMAAPRAESSDGLMAEDSVAGAWMGVELGKSWAKRWAILGVCEDPPARMTWG